MYLGEPHHVGDGLTVVEDLCGLSRVEGCLHPVPKPGPCPGTRRTGGLRRAARKVTAKPKTTRTAKGPAYTGPSVTVSPEDRHRMDEYKRLRDAENDPTLRGDELTRVRADFDKAKAALSPKMRARAVQEYRIGNAAKQHRTGEPDTAEQAQAKMQAELQRMFAGKRIATRVTAEGLAGILRDGRFKTQHETGYSGLAGAYVPDERAKAEELLFGIPETGFDDTRRPYYGYVMVNGDTPPADDAMLNAYGPVQVVFKDGVRDRTTAMIGDSLNDFDRAKPSPVNAPEHWSFKPTRLRPGDYDHDPAGEDFRNGEYAEAQIHDGVTVGDVAEVVFPQAPEQSLRDALDQKGIPWRVAPAQRR